MAIWANRISEGDIVIDAKPAPKSKTQLIGVVLQIKKYIELDVNLRLGHIYWFGIVKDLNNENEIVLALEKDRKIWIPLSRLQLLKKAVNE